jgi:uncharacterized membrane protein
LGLDKLTALWHRVRDGLWFVPTVVTLGSVALALVTIQLDVMDVLPEAPAGVWLFSGTASGARGVLTAIASGFITVTGVVFSITIVALQLASTQFTPRILRNFTSDRANQLVLGVFIATFTYALLVLRVVRGEQGGLSPEQVETGARSSETLDAFVPNLSVTVAVALAIVSIAFLIFFIDHAARSVQASVIIDRVKDDALRTVERLLPEDVGTAGEADVRTVVPDAQGGVVTARESGYLQGVDDDALLDLVGEAGLTLRMEPAIGDFILPGRTLATVWPAGLAEDGIADRIRSAFILGQERTPHYDLELGLIELVDIAVKALSPGINDPTTAVLCVDRICEVLAAFARRDPPGRVRLAPAGVGVLILPAPDYEALVNASFDEIRHYGAGNPRFAMTLLDRFGELGVLLPPDRRPALARHAAATLRQARSQVPEPADVRRVEAAAQRSLERLGVGTPD